jgi:hypothetical protein
LRAFFARPFTMTTHKRLGWLHFQRSDTGERVSAPAVAELLERDAAWGERARMSLRFRHPAVEGVVEWDSLRQEVSAVGLEAQARLWRPVGFIPKSKALREALAESLGRMAATSLAGAPGEPPEKLARRVRLDDWEPGWSFDLAWDPALGLGSSPRLLTELAARPGLAPDANDEKELAAWLAADITPFGGSRAARDNSPSKASRGSSAAASQASEPSPAAPADNADKAVPKADATPTPAPQTPLAPTAAVGSEALATAAAAPASTLGKTVEAAAVAEHGSPRPAAQWGAHAPRAENGPASAPASPSPSERDLLAAAAAKPEASSPAPAAQAPTQTAQSSSSTPAPASAGDFSPPPRPQLRREASAPVSAPVASAPQPAPAPAPASAAQAPAEPSDELEAASRSRAPLEKPALRFTTARFPAPLAHSGPRYAPVEPGGLDWSGALFCCHTYMAGDSFEAAKTSWAGKIENESGRKETLFSWQALEALRAHGHPIEIDGASWSEESAARRARDFVLGVWAKSEDPAAQALTARQRLAQLEGQANELWKRAVPWKPTREEESPWPYLDGVLGENGKFGSYDTPVSYWPAQKAQRHAQWIEPSHEDFVIEASVSRLEKPEDQAEADRLAAELTEAKRLAAGASQPTWARGHQAEKAQLNADKPRAGAAGSSGGSGGQPQRRRPRF